MAKHYLTPLTCWEREEIANEIILARIINDPMVALATIPDGSFSRVIAIMSNSGCALPI